MRELQEKLDLLLDKYDVGKKAVLKDRKTVTVDGVDVPILAHRSERRFVELRKLALGGTLRGVSVMRVACIAEKGADVFGELYRELDVCRFVLGKKIVAVTAMQNDNTLNVIATLETGVVCTIEIAATLEAGEAPKGKHEIISERGIACDVVVDAQLIQDSVYIFGSENKKFTDVDFELYGLSAHDVAVVRTAFEAARSADFALELANADKELKILVEKAKKSVATEERQVIFE